MFTLSTPFFFNDTTTTPIYTLSLHDALPISGPLPALGDDGAVVLRLRNIAWLYLFINGFPEFQFVIGALVDVNGVGAGAGLVAGAFQFGAPQAGFQVEPV